MYEGSLCVCCMSTEELVDLFEDNIDNNHNENYAKMLETCLNIHLSVSDGHDSICTNCICKLRDCVTFKKRALISVSILSSIDITLLISREDMQILGMNEQKELKITSNNKGLEINNTVTDITIDLTNTENKNCEINQDLSEKIGIADTAKRRVGRPRTNPLDVVPYKITKDEVVCRECGVEFPTNVGLRVHLNTHFGRHACETCNKKFMTYQSLVHHKACHRRGPFPCETCGQIFNNIHTLRSHKRYKHRSVSRFPCKMCGEAFNTIQRRLKHMSEVHACTEMRYKCKYCEKRFRHGGDLSKHIAYHHEVKFFSCPICAVRCRRDALRKHLNSHLRREGMIATDRRFVCKFCSKSFCQKNTIKHHINAHIIEGEYAGDHDYLIVDKRLVDNERGLLSDINTGDLDESILSEDIADVTTINVENIDTHIDGEDIDTHLDGEDIDTHIDGEDIDTHIDGEDIDKHIDGEDFDIHIDTQLYEKYINSQINENEDNLPEVFTDVGFPSDFDD